MPVESFGGRLMMWTMICGVSAAPSFFIAIHEHSQPHQVLAMSLGVAIFIACYTWVTGTPAVRRLNEKPFVRRTAYIGYGTRILISIIWPIGFILDLFCGAASDWLLGLTADTFVQRDSFAGVLIWTLVQGVVLNAVLFAYMLPVYGVQTLFCDEPRKGCCVKCGYDLRASSERCPECGEPIALTVSEE